MSTKTEATIEDLYRVHEDGKAEIWLTDDDRRLMVQMKSDMKIGSLNLYLRSYAPPTAPASSSDSSSAK